MTQDEIIWQNEVLEMARQTGLSGHYYANSNEPLKAFAKLVEERTAAKEQKKWEDQTAVEIHEAVLEEREACAKVAENGCNYPCADEIAAAIRARGEA